MVHKMGMYILSNQSGPVNENGADPSRLALPGIHPIRP